MKKKTVMIMCAVFTMLTSMVSCSGKAQRSADTIPADTLQASLIIEDSTPPNDAVNKLNDSISHVKINPADKQDPGGLMFFYFRQNMQYQSGAGAITRYFVQIYKK